MTANIASARVELFSIWTGENCSLTSLPSPNIGPTGAFFQGFHVFCSGVSILNHGSFLEDPRCFKYTQNSWQQVKIHIRCIVNLTHISFWQFRQYKSPELFDK